MNRHWPRWYPCVRVRQNVTAYGLSGDTVPFSARISAGRATVEERTARRHSGDPTDRPLLVVMFRYVLKKREV